MAPSAHCEAVQIEYATPFWHAPYRRCSLPVEDTLQTFQLDADNTVVELYASWPVAASDRRAEFARATAALARRLGPGIVCSEGTETDSAIGAPLLAFALVNWRAQDSVRAALLMKPRADVGHPDSVDYEISLHARLSPQPDAFWCRRTLALWGR